MKDLLNDLDRYLINYQIMLDQTIEYLKLFEIINLEPHA